MINVMIIGENKELLKQVYGRLSEDELYRIFIVSFSLNAIEEYVKRKPAIVIVDEETVAPYTTIIEQLNEWEWEHKIIVLTSIEKDLYESGEIHYLNKEHIDDELTSLTFKLANKVENKVDEQVEKTQKLPFELKDMIDKRELFMLFAVRYLGEDASFPLEKKIQQVIELYGHCEHLYLDECTKIFVIHKSKGKATGQWNEICEALMKSVGRDCVLFTNHQIPWNRLGLAYSQLEQVLEKGYFYRGQVVNPLKIDKDTGSASITEIDEGLGRLFQSVFSDRKREIEEHLSELVFNVIGKKRDYAGIMYLRRMTIIMERVTNSLVGKQNADKGMVCRCMEKELDNLKMRYIALAEKIEEKKSDKKVLQVAVNAILYIFRFYYEDITLESVADELKVTKIYLSRVFKNEVTVTFLDLLQIVRMQVAKHYMIHTELKVSEIGKLVGYEDAHYFSRLFKKRTMHSPEAYKKFIKELDYESFM